jgi:hypothetical protein
MVPADAVADGFGALLRRLAQHMLQLRKDLLDGNETDL